MRYGGRFGAGLVGEFRVIDRCAASCCAADAASLMGAMFAVPRSPSDAKGERGTSMGRRSFAGGEASELRVGRS